MSIGNIGFILLAYVIIGWILDMICVFTLMLIAGYKDVKKEKALQSKVAITDHLDAISDVLDDADKTIESGTEDKKESAMVKFIIILIARILWPIAVPAGVSVMWDAIKSRD